MKFRAVIYDQIHMREFLNIALTISKLSKDCLIRIQTDGIYLLVSEETSLTTTPMLWCHIPKEVYFSEYIMYGVNDEYNEILMSLSSGNLARALSSVKNNVNYVKIKLAKREFPCLTVEIDVPLQNSVESNKVIHEIPIMFIPHQDWTEFNIPDLPEFHITTFMPTLRSMKNLVDQLKLLAPYMTLCATSSGDLSLVVETDEAVVASHCKNLIVEAVDQSRPVKEDEEIEVSCRNDLKKFSTFLSSIQFQNIPMLCSITQDHVIKIMVRIREDITINFIIPAISS